MSTRGLMGIKKKGELKAQYNHFDSYVEGLGKNIIKDICSIPKESRIDKLNKTFDNIILLDEDKKPTKEQIDYCMENNVCDTNVASGDINDIYCLLRKTQGDLNLYLNGFKYMLNGNDFLEDTIFCEYGYVINLDTNRLEIYTNGILNAEYDLLKLNYSKVKKDLVNEEW